MEVVRKGPRIWFLCLRSLVVVANRAGTVEIAVGRCRVVTAPPGPLSAARE